MSQAILISPSRSQRARQRAAPGRGDLRSPAAAWRSFLRLLSVVREDRALLAMLVALFLLDGLVVGLHIARQLAVEGFFAETVLASPRLDLSHRMGLGRFLELSTLAMAVPLGILAFARSREPIYFCAAAALAAVLAVTGFGIHLPVGRMIGTLLPIGAVYPASAPDIGKAIALGVAGTGLLALLLWGAGRSSAGHARLGLVMAATVVLLGLFAGGIDLVHALVHSRLHSLGLVLVVVEEGGELLVVAIALMLMAVAARRPGRIVDLG